MIEMLAETVDSVDTLQHPLIREALRLTGIDGGVEITSIGDIDDELKRWLKKAYEMDA